MILGSYRNPTAGQRAGQCWADAIDIRVDRSRNLSITSVLKIFHLLTNAITSNLAVCSTQSLPVMESDTT